MRISQHRLAEAMRAPRRRVNEIIHGTRRITPGIGLCRSKVVGMSEEFWIGLQADYGIAMTKRQHPADLAAVEYLGS